jgi:alkylation response protein AidB-like acyl-CoA dehydrogenase
VDFALTPPQRAIQAEAAALAATELLPRAGALDASGGLPIDQMAAVRAAGLLSLVAPAEFGGRAAGTLANTLVVEAFARACGSTALCFAMHSGALTYLARAATPLQREALLAPVVAAGALCTLAISQPGAHDELGRPGVAWRRDGSDYRLNGVKTFVTGAPLADCLLTTATPDGTTATPSTVFWVRADSPGVAIRRTWDGAGMRGSASDEVCFEAVTLPAARRLGEEDGGRRALQPAQAVSVLGLAAACLGAATAAYEVAAERGRRRLAGLPPERRRPVTAPAVDLGRIEILLAGARLLLYQAAWLDERADPALQPAIYRAKAACNAAGREAADAALQAYGGHGYRRDHPLERRWREARAGALMIPTYEAAVEGLAAEALGLDPWALP